MKLPQTSDQAQIILKTADPSWKAFWFRDGTVVSSLAELAEALEAVDAETYRHHVDGDKNDLAVWIDQVVGDPDLARHLSRIKRQRSAWLAVSRRVSQLTGIAQL